jgi:hypothetical protein
MMRLSALPIAVLMLLSPTPALACDWESDLQFGSKTNTLTPGSKRLLKIYTEERGRGGVPTRFLVTFYGNSSGAMVRRAGAVRAYLQSLGVPPPSIRIQRTDRVAPIWVRDGKEIRITTTVDLVNGCGS